MVLFAGESAIFETKHLLSLHFLQDYYKAMHRAKQPWSEKSSIHAYPKWKSLARPRRRGTEGSERIRARREQSPRSSNESYW
jgi:hypothetical protein